MTCFLTYKTVGDQISLLTLNCGDKQAQRFLCKCERSWEPVFILLLVQFWRRELHISRCGSTSSRWSRISPGSETGEKKHDFLHRSKKPPLNIFHWKAAHAKWTLIRQALNLLVNQKLQLSRLLHRMVSYGVTLPQKSNNLGCFNASFLIYFSIEYTGSIICGCNI